LLVVAAARLLTLPASPWELDELLFMRGVERFAPLEHRPHPPGYPLTIGLGKVFSLLTGDAFRALVASSVVTSLVGFLALVDAFSRLLAGGAAPGPRERRLAVAGALLFHLSPPMLVFGPLAYSDSPALCFLSLALAAAARLRGRGTSRAAFAMGAFGAAAVGCRPQLVVAVVPMLLAAMAWGVSASSGESARGGPAPAAGVAGAGPRTGAGRSRRLVLAGGVGFALTALAWAAPLAVACGGLGGLLGILGRQAELVTALDAGSARGVLSTPAVVARFVFHPWGTKVVSAPLVLAAAVGLLELLRRRRLAASPLLVLAAVDLAFALAYMDPADAARYALPSLLAVSLLVAVGLGALADAVARPALAWVATGALLAGFVAFTGPLLRVRSTTASPPVQAADWARKHLPADAEVLVAPPLIPHAAELLGGRRFTVADPGPSRQPLGAGGRVYLFADGETGWPGAAVFRWPRSEAWGKLTRGYYRVASWSPLPDCRITPVQGVYGWEPGWRWLDRDARLRVQTGGAPRLALTLGLPPTSPYAEAEVDVEAAGGGAARLRVLRASRRSAQVWLPPQPSVEIRLRVDRAFVPAVAGLNSDRRRLAVQLVACGSVDAR
jgi:hypothetical protein